MLVCLYDLLSSVAFSALIHIRAFKDVAPFTVTSPGGSPAKVTTSTTAGTSQIEVTSCFCACVRACVLPLCC